MTFPSFLMSVALLAAGAVIGFVPTYVNERRKERYTLRTRWDVPLFELSKDFVNASRQIVHLSRRLNRVADKSAQNQLIDEQHLKLRSLEQQLRILGNADVQAAAQEVVHHVYAVRATAEGKPDARADDGDPSPPVERARRAIRPFFVAVRTQLGVQNPGEMGPEANTADDPWNNNGQQAGPTRR
jgi:hypothetical protein